MDGCKKIAFFSFPLSLVVISAAMSCGMLAAVLLPVLPPVCVLLLLAVVVGCFCCSRFRVVPVLGWVLLGVCWGAYCGRQAMSAWLPAVQENREMEISGHVLDFPQARERGWQFDFYSDHLGGKVRLSLYDFDNGQFHENPAEVAASTVSNAQADAQPPRFDCHYRLLVKLRRPRGLQNFGLYDYQGWLLQSGYRATGYVRAVLACDPYHPSPILLWRQRVADVVNELSISDAARSSLLALLIGSYAEIDALQWQLLRDSGTIHLLSVSGLHIVFMAMLAHFLVFHLCRLLVIPARWWPADLWGNAAALLCAVGYALLAGFSVATQRSLIMVAVAVVQRLLYGRFMPSTALLLALLLVLMWNPLAVLSSSFWFSFWATAVLLMSGGGDVTGGQRQPSRLRMLQEAVRLQWLMFVLLMPLLLYVYGRVPLLSLPVNFLAVPWVSFLSLPLAFAGLLLLPVSSVAGEFFLHASAWSLDIYWRALRAAVAYGEQAWFELGGVPLPFLLSALAGLSLVCLLSRPLWLRIACLLLCLPAILPVTQVARGDIQLTVLDVGQGLSIIARTTSHTMVYDTGDRRSERFDTGRDIVAPSLRNLQVNHVDMLMLSHADSDHAGGAAGLIQEFPPRQLWSGTPEQLHVQHEFSPCRSGMHWRWDSVDFQVLHPDEQNVGSDNDRGCVLMVEANGKRVLLAADIEKMSEQQLLQRGVDLQADVLVAPHHGSKTSSSTAFLDAVQAKQVIVSSGFLNRFHHPSPEVLRRYRDRDMQIFNTADSGAVRLLLSGHGIDVALAVCDNRRFWRESVQCTPALSK